LLFNTNDFIKFYITHLPVRYIHDHFPFKGLSASVYHIQVRARFQENFIHVAQKTSFTFLVMRGSRAHKEQANFIIILYARGGSLSVE
jgi:hypothetical protein